MRSQPSTRYGTAKLDPHPLAPSPTRTHTLPGEGEPPTLSCSTLLGRGRPLPCGCECGWERIAAYPPSDAANTPCHAANQRVQDPGQGSHAAKYSFPSSGIDNSAASISQYAVDSFPRAVGSRQLAARTLYFAAFSLSFAALWRFRLSFPLGAKVCCPKFAALEEENAANCRGMTSSLRGNAASCRGAAAALSEWEVSPDLFAAEYLPGGTTMSRAFTALRALLYSTGFIALWAWLAFWARDAGRGWSIVLPAWLVPLGIVLMIPGAIVALSCIASFVFV